MPLQRPRRIFRASGRPVGPRVGRIAPAVWAGLLGAAAGSILILFALPSDLFGRVPTLSGMLTAPPQSVAVVDGETLVLRETVIRLQGIAAPSRGQACAADGGTGRRDCGAASADALAQLVRGHDVACQLNGRDREGFARGLCEAGGTELNRTLVAAGWAHARGTTPGSPDGFSAEETQAQVARLGLWSSGSF